MSYLEMGVVAVVVLWFGWLALGWWRMYRIYRTTKDGE